MGEPTSFSPCLFENKTECAAPARWARAVPARPAIPRSRCRRRRRCCRLPRNKRPQLKVSVSGIVTAAEPDWKGQFFVQDPTGGVFVENLGRPGPAPGDVVTVAGVSHPGAFAPIISAPQWRITGTAPLPEPKRVSIENLKAGVEDGLRVEISGVVRTAHIEEGRLVVHLAMGGYRLEVFARVPPDVVPASLVAARVRVRGTTATHYNTSLRQLTAVAVYVPRLDDFAVFERESAPPFEQPVMPINSVAQYRRGSRSDQRVHVRGAVTLQRSGRNLSADRSGGIRIETTQPEGFSPGDQIDAVGFRLRDFCRFCATPRLRRGARRWRRGSCLSRNPAQPAPRQPDRCAGRSGSSRPTRPGRPVLPTQTTWLLQGDEITFTVEHEGRGGCHARGDSDGSVVEADGVCVSTADATGPISSLRLLLARPPACACSPRGC